MDFTSLFDYSGAAAAHPPQVEELVFLPRATPEDWAKLIDHTEARRFAAGDVVVREGSAAQELYIVTRGSLEVLVDGDKAGELRRIAAIEPGSVFGEQSFVDGKPRSANVRALSDGEIRSLTLPAFEVLAAKEPALARMVLFDLARILSLRLRQTTGRVRNLGLG
jgi:CRP/FNR family transcriptional regulator, cyclic AMP receptor protein